MLTLSRRAFFEGMAAVSLAAPLFGAESRPRVVVVGGSGFGGWTALHLRRLGADVTLLDAWGPGHSRASSGGETRVIRSAYGVDRIYVEMVKRSYDLWEQLDATTDETLYVETGALWMHRDSDAYVRSSAPAMHEMGFPLEQIPLGDAARRYPQIRFDGVRSVWLERRAGVLSARQSCAVVRDALVDAGGTWRTAHAMPGAIESGRMASLELGDGTRLEADAFVFACGPWLGRVFPDVIGERVRPTRQEVCYFGTPRGSDRYQPSKLPVWIDFGERVIYGIPDTHARGFKMADDTRGETIDPTTMDRSITAAVVARMRALLAERFPELKDAPLVHGEVCQYENSPDGNLIVDRHPRAANVWIAGGGSGHGFKFSPALGEMVAHAVLASKPLPPLFRLDRDAKPSTQFERRE